VTPDDAARRAGRGAGDALLVDGHVHFHPRFSAAGFLDAAARNLRRRGSADGEPDGPARRRVRLVLMLADPAGRDSLCALSATLGDVTRWEVRETAEEVSRLALGEEGGPIALVAGRQVATEEGLEVLALATDAEIPGGLPARETVDASLAAGAVTVVPWGFGKWWLRRGRVVRRLVESVDHPLFFLGDNGGRPRAAPEPSLFRAARRRGTAVLAGSDPLPFSREEERVGSYGFVLPARRADDGGRRPGPGEGPSDGAAPAAALRARLERLAGSPPTFGRRAGLGRFAVHQIAMQLARGRRR
jgi:hypothetical protein